jgi:malate dehydrogenase (oxaloacetate-decarboxylating)
VKNISASDIVIETALSGQQLLADPFLNKSSAFPVEERIAFGLTGLLPLHVSTMEEQLKRTYENYRLKDSPLEKYVFLAALQDRNETLFYRLVQTHIAEMVPILYTPTVGEACQKYSHIFRRPRGLYLSYPDPHSIPDILRTSAPDDIEVIVVTDGERILGLGDLGVGGMGIPVGKLSLYTLCAGIHPRKTLPVLLDVGTNNPELIQDPLYLGWRHPRLEVEEYDRFIDLFVNAVKDRWPRAILQWEDFSKNNAWRLLERYRGHLTTFNDDIQGTAAVTVAGLLRAVRISGRPLKTERVIILGAGSAATGIAALLCEALRHEGLGLDQARESIWLIDTHGLVHEGRTDLSVEKQAYAQSLEHVHSVGLDATGRIDLAAVVRQVKPTTLIGTSGQPKVFDEPLVRTMAQAVDRPTIFPLSNPTSKSEAIPEDLLAWTEGRAIVATGSPFPAVTCKGRRIPIGQCNNAFIFPGVGLGLVASRARRIPEEVFLAAARTLSLFDKRSAGDEDCLFPNLEDVRFISEQIALAVAKEILRLGLSHETVTPESLPERVRRQMWEPVYPKLKPLRSR